MALPGCHPERSRGINAERFLFPRAFFRQIASRRSLRAFASACASLTWSMTNKRARARKSPASDQGEVRWGLTGFSIFTVAGTPGVGPRPVRHSCLVRHRAQRPLPLDYGSEAARPVRFTVDLVGLSSFSDALAEASPPRRGGVAKAAQDVAYAERGNNRLRLPVIAPIVGVTIRRKRSWNPSPTSSLCRTVPLEVGHENHDTTARWCW